jgi:predicted nucleic acid-binding protein
VTVAGALVASALVLGEVPRAAARHGIAPDAPAVVTLLGGLRLLQVEPVVLGVAAALRPPALRPLDAVHLASVLSVRDRIDALVAYDARLLEAAREHGLPVLTPGATP